MVDVTSSILISCPIGQVAEYASNPDNAIEWYVNIKSVEWKTAKPLEVGSQIAFKARFLGRELSYVYEIKELIPNSKLVMRTADGPFPMETTYTWTLVEDGSTKMTLRNIGQPAGFSKIVAPLMRVAMRRANLKDLKLLKKILEEDKMLG